ncbi:uncharacterized protein LOC131950467 [Physella acuta]|uniref:uncharacterized protein LOC131950467 n=1 Tax=Physella acuta TaxID=109671 RepID=UPI0027DB9C01|nr:uncharacterized protein LOC131950467 [Physella acuta]
MVIEFLEILGTHSSDNLKTICLNLCHVDGMKLFPGPIHAFDTVLTKFKNLNRLEIGYINQQLIENLAESLSANFKQFCITVHDGIEARISDWAWMALKTSCPDLGVTLNVTDNLLHVLLSPKIPLVNIAVQHIGSFSHQFGIKNIAKLFKHSLEELHIRVYDVEPDQYDKFFTHLASFQRLTTFSMSMHIKTEQNIKFLRAFGDMLKRPNTLRDVTFKYHDSRTIGSKVRTEIDKLKEEFGLLLKFEILD